MGAGNDGVHDLLELADETDRVAESIDDLSMRTRLHEIAGELREQALLIAV
jgi:hypothetical protein